MNGKLRRNTHQATAVARVMEETKLKTHIRGKSVPESEEKLFTVKNSIMLIRSRKKSTKSEICKRREFLFGGREIIINLVAELLSSLEEEHH